MPSSRSSRPRDGCHNSYVSCIGKWVLYHEQPLGKPPEIHIQEPHLRTSECDSVCRWVFMEVINEGLYGGH